MATIGDKIFKGNRHVRLSPDARTATVSIDGRAVTTMHGKWEVLLPAVARMAAAGEISVTFRVDKTLDVSFDEHDLRKLSEGISLQAVLGHDDPRSSFDRADAPP